MKKFLSLMVALLVLATVPAFADTIENNDGTVTLTTDNGVTLTYTKDEFEVTVDENGDVAGSYTGESPEPIHFTVATMKDTDAEAYINEQAAAHSAEVEKIAAFDEEAEWFSFSYEEAAADGNTNTVTVYARNCEGGCYVVTAYSYFTADAADAETTDDGDAIDGSVELTMILDSMSFAK